MTTEASLENPSGSRLRRVAVWLLVATVFVPFVYWTGVLYPAATVRAVVFRVLVQAAGLCLLFLLARHRAGHRFRGDPFLWSFAAFVLFGLISALAGPTPIRSLFGTMERMWGVLTWAHFLLFYLLLRLLLQEEHWVKLFRLSLVVSVAVALAGIVGHHADSLGLPAYIGREPRVLATLGNPGYVAVYAFLHFGLALWLWDRARRPGWRIFCLAAAGLHVWVYLLAGTRAIALGAVGAAALLGLAVVVLRAAKRLRSDASVADEATRKDGPGPRWLSGRILRRASLAVGVAAILTAGVIAALPGDGPNLRDVPGAERLRDHVFDRSLGLRVLAWNAALEGVRERPILGAGPENFRAVYNRNFDPREYRLKQETKQFDRVHNAFLEVLTASGIPGFLAYLGMWAALLLGLYRGWRDGRLGTRETLLFAWMLLGYAIYLFFWFEDHSSTILFVALAAYIWHRHRGAPVADVAPRERSSRPPSGAVASPLFGLLFLAALPIAALTTHHQGVNVLRAGHAARSAETAPDPWAAVERYRGALSVGATQSPEIAVELSRFLARLSGWMVVRAGDDDVAGKVDEALGLGIEALTTAIERDPGNVLLLIRRSLLQRIAYRIFGRDSDFRAAEADLERALELGPRRVRLHHHLAELYLLKGDPTRALAVLDEAAAIHDGFGETAFYRARVRFAMGEREEAFVEIRRAFSMAYAGGGSRFTLELGAWLEGEGRHADAADLYRAYLALEYPHLHPYDRARENPRFYALPDQRIAFRLPLAEFRAGDEPGAIRTAANLSRQLPAESPMSAGRAAALDEFITDVRRGQGERWRMEEWIASPLTSQ